MKINLFNSSGKNAKKSISAAELVNLIPYVGQDKAGGGIAFEPMPGQSLYFSGLAAAADEYIDIYGVSTNAHSGSFESRVYVIHWDDSAGTYNVSAVYWHIIGEFTAVFPIGTLTGATGDFTNFTHDATKHGGKVVFGDRGANKLFVVTMANDPISDTVAIYTMPTGWALQTMDFQDGYFIGNIKDTGTNDEQRKFVASDFGATTFPSSSYGLLTSASGNLIAIESDKREVWLYCDDHIEPWYKTPGESFPFLRNPSVYIDIGLYSRDTIARFDNSVFFLGTSNKGGIGIYQITGYTPSEITPPEIKRILSSGTYDEEVKFSTARAIKIGGFRLYIINFFLTDLGTWCYNVDAGLWSKLKSDSLEWWNYIKGYTYFHVRNTTTTFLGYHLAIPYKSFTVTENGILNLASIDTLSVDLFSEVERSYANAGTLKDLTRVAISDHIYGDGNKDLVHQKLTLEFVPSSATVDLSWSDDNGTTYTTPETHSLSTGIVERFQLGSSPDRLYKLEFTDVYDTSLINAWIDAKQARH